MIAITAVCDLDHRLGGLGWQGFRACEGSGRRSALLSTGWQHDSRLRLGEGLRTIVWVLVLKVRLKLLPRSFSILISVSVHTLSGLAAGQPAIRLRDRRHDRRDRPRCHTHPLR